MGILLKNGLVYNGENNPPIYQDIYIENGIIKTLGRNLNIDKAKVIDCSNLCVAPGFIDAHSHNDFFVNNEDNEVSNLPFLKQGITTQVVGNCGFSAYGVSDNSPYKNLIGEGLFRCDNPGSLDEFAKSVEGKLLQNLIPLIGHGTTRMSVVGKDTKPLSQDEIEEEMKVVEEGLKQGAFGGSYGLMYEPGMFATQEELIAFAEMIKKYDGILTIHPRANSSIALGYPLLTLKPHIELGLDEVIDIMEKTNVKVEYSHLIFVGKSSWKCVDTMLKKFKTECKKGYEIAYDLYPFTYGASVITVILPSWYLKLTIKDRHKPLNRIKLKLIISLTKKLLGLEYSDLVISYIGKDYPQYEGKNVADIAKEEKMKPFDMYLKLVDLSNGKGRIMLGKYYNEEIINKLMNDNLSVYMTDAWYEYSGTQNAGTYQAFPFFLQKTRQHNIPLEATIYKMTGQTALRFQIENRGFIKEGYAADFTIFNYNEIKINENKPDQTPTGMKYVIVNGEVTIDNNQYTGVKSGILMRRKQK